MTTPVDVATSGQRQPRRGRKQPTSNNQFGAQANASTSAARFTMPMPAMYDGSSEPTASPTANRKNRKQAHMSEANGYSGAPNSHKQAHRQRGPSQSHPAPPNASHATPIKSAAYAGPTFHASPAASSLPIPKMFSKSLPDPGPILPPSLVAEDSDIAQTDSEDTSRAPSFTPEPNDREPSPLDFLFDAARKARNSSGPIKSPDLPSGTLSPNQAVNGSGTATPTNRGGAVFPFELDGTCTPTNSIGPAFATPYSERMNAYRSRDSFSHNSDVAPNEHERLAKAEGLKKLLGHSPSPKPPTAPSYSYENHRPSPQRHHSGPNTPTQFQPNQGNQYRQSPTAFASGDFPFRDIITQRPPSSKLRQEVSPPTYSGPAVTNAGYGSPSPSRTPQSMDAKRLEDDLRRVLKLDASS